MYWLSKKFEINVDQKEFSQLRYAAVIKTLYYQYPNDVQSWIGRGVSKGWYKAGHLKTWMYSKTSALESPACDGHNLTKMISIICILDRK